MARSMQRTASTQAAYAMTAAALQVVTVQSVDSCTLLENAMAFQLGRGYQSLDILPFDLHYVTNYRSSYPIDPLLFRRLEWIDSMWYQEAWKISWITSRRDTTMCQCLSLKMVCVLNFAFALFRGMES